MCSVVGDRTDGYLCLAGCDDPAEKKEAVITANSYQEFAYDGTEHLVQATLNHDETALTYDPAQGFTEIGEYKVTISAAETANYKAASKTVTVAIVDDTPVETIGDRWDAFVSDMQTAYNLSKADVRFDVQATANLTATAGEAQAYSLSAKGNLDLTNAVDNTSALRIVAQKGETVAFGLYYQNSTMYLRIADQILAINNSDIASLFPASSAPVTYADGESSQIQEILDLLGSIILFNDLSDIAKVDNVWTLKLDSEGIWSRVKGLAGMFLSAENIAILDNFLATNKTVVTLTFDLTTINVPVVSASADIASYGKVDAAVTADIANGAFDTVDGLLTEDEISAATAVNLANITAKGTFSLMTVKDVPYMTYNWELNADIDPFTLTKVIQEYAAGSNPYGWTEDARVKDMMFHLSVYHVHDENCTSSYCTSRISGTPTNFIDIAWHPAQFGNGQFYVNLNSGALVSSTAVVEILRIMNIDVGSLGSSLGSIIGKVLSKNALIPLDVDAMFGGYDTAAPAQGAASSDIATAFTFDPMTMLDPIVSVITQGIFVDNASVGIRMEQVMNAVNAMVDLEGALGGILSPAALNELIATVFGADGSYGTENAFGGFRLALDSVTFGEVKASEYNTYDKVVKTDPVTQSPREYTEGKVIDHSNPANANLFASSIFTMGETDLYKDGLTTLSVEELELLQGAVAEYKYTGLDGTEDLANKTQIVGFRGVDYTKKNEAQTITLITLPLDGRGVFGGIFYLLFDDFLGSMIGRFVDITGLKLPIAADKLSLDLTLSDITSIACSPKAELTKEIVLNPYSIDTSAQQDMSSYISGVSTTVTYANGQSKTIKLDASATNLVDGKYVRNDGTQYYVEFEYYGQKQRFDLKVTSPTDPSVTYADDQVKLILPQAASDVKVNLFLSKSSYKVDKLEEKYYSMNATVEESYTTDKPAAYVLCADTKTMINFTVDCPRGSYYLGYTLQIGDGEPVDTVLGINAKFEKNMFCPGETEFGTVTGGNFGSYLNDMVTYYYLPTDADATVGLKLRYDADSKSYFMTDDNGLSIPATVEAYLPADKEHATNVLDENGLIKAEYLKQNSSTIKFTLVVNFTVNDQPVNLVRENFTVKGNYMQTVFVTGFVAESDVVITKFKMSYIDPTDWTVVEMTGAWKDGKAVLTDANGKVADIDVTLEITCDGAPVELNAAGQIPSSYVGKKVTITAKASVNGIELTATHTNKTVK